MCEETICAFDDDTVTEKNVINLLEMTEGNISLYILLQYLNFNWKQ
jgi:hypothetical protein